MPFAFKNSGLALGVFLTVLVYIICTHGSYMVVQCAHELYRRTRVTSMTFADVGEIAFAHGPPWGRKYAKLARISILSGLFLAYFGTCSVYAVIISENFRQVISQYAGYELNQRLCISLLLIPLILLSWIPDLKYLAPVSMVANVFMGLGLCITFSYLFEGIESPLELPQVGRFYDLPQFFSVTIFTMEVIGVVMPLENSMERPQDFIGIYGILMRGMGIVTCIFISLGFMGYLRYKEETNASITLNLPSSEYLAQSVKILIGLAVLCSYNLQFFVCLEIVWNAVKGKLKMNQLTFEYIVRTALTASAGDMPCLIRVAGMYSFKSYKLSQLIFRKDVFLAVAVPTIGPFLALIGAFCFSLLGLIIPPLIDTVTFWDRGFGRFNWLAWKNFGMFLFGLVALVSGSYTSIVDIVKDYGKNETVAAVPIQA